ncbi:MAG: CDP-paratose 2-epimerase [Thermoleophilales bacterium]|nr:CDP-paratose 2-epimerase [Thermoleophilales bacterium]
MTVSERTSDRRVLITGGAGFVGANLCLELAARHPDWRIVAFDNLKRRGSEINLPRLKEAGVEFAHGDVRSLADLLELDPVNAIVECSAEPSVLAGIDGGTEYVVNTNLSGAYHCLELARRDHAQMIFLSTSRVYPVAAQESIAWTEAETRFEIAPEQELQGVSPAGISEAFPLEGARTLYGTTKLSGELLIAEYAETFGIPATINRCGVIAGPWQMGKVDQGVFTHWVLSHYTGRSLRYIGYGGKGKQVRDLLHIDDLVDLIEDQLLRPEHWSGSTANVGGGRDCSLSLLETTEICRELTGNAVQVEATDETRPGDLRIYLSDCGRLFEHTDWRPRRGPRDILVDIFEWIRNNERSVLAALG